VGENVFLKVKAKKHLLKLGSFPKMSTRYCGPFEILERIGLVAYMLTLHASMCIHNVFQVYLIRKDVPDANHVIDWNVIQVEQEGDFRVQLVCILDMKFKLFQNQAIVLVKFHWTNYGPKDATWEYEDAMCEEYSHIFGAF
jgi:hypothetical protein